ncbi:MAG: preprotein translocase subunit YajC [Saprospiraceae bacterium]
MLNQLILLQAEGSGILNLVMIGGIFIVMYFFMIRPQAKRQKEQQAFTEALEKGDRVVTAAGIHGKIVAINGTVVTVEITKGVNIKIEKDFISKELSTRSETEEA